MLPAPKALARQTAWSRDIFQRMRSTQRRVGQLAIDQGAGEGAFLAVLVLPPSCLADPHLPALLERELAAAVRQDGLVRAALLRTDAALSTPVTSGAAPAEADALVLVEASHPEPARTHAHGLAAQLELPQPRLHAFRLLWRLP